MTGQAERPDRLVIRKLIPASREEVYASWIDPESIRHWMCPGEIMTADAQLDPRVGGAYRIVMKGRTGAYEHRGEYLVVDPPAKLVFTWISKSTQERPTLVTVELLARGGQCELVLIHERFPSADAMVHHKSGWGQIVDRLADYLRQRAGSPSLGIRQ